MNLIINGVKIKSNNIYVDLNIDGNLYSYVLTIQKNNITVFNGPKDFWEHMYSDKSKIKPFFKIINEVIKNNKGLLYPIEVNDDN